MLNFLLFTILGVFLIIIIILIFKLTRSKEDTLLHQKLDSSSQAILTEFSKLYEKLGGLDKESRDILDLTKSFHDILKPTKTRSILGENIVDNVIKDVLPQETIASQYAFKNGKKVDFVIKLPQGFVPIDAKFSLESFKNYVDALPREKEKQKKSFIDSVKKRIDETRDYIFPDEGTTDFSLMYVPSEAVYYSIITETPLLDYAHKKKVFVVGPNTFYAYLKTILIGFQALNVERRTKEIYTNLQRLEKEIRDMVEDYSVLGVHLKNAASKYEDVRKKLESLSFKLENISQGE